MRAMLEGVKGIRDEFERHGTEEDKLCMSYVLDGEAGSCDVVFPNGNLKLDCDEEGRLLEERQVIARGESRRGMRLVDFASHDTAQIAKLTLAEVAALRLYTTAAFKGINDPLRDFERLKRKEQHPFALTVVLISKAVLKLRAVGALGADAYKKVCLYRGMRNVDLPNQFLQEGGTEVSPMSTTANIQIALAYSAGAQGVLFCLHTSSAMERGADLSFLSCFPGESEFLYPPLTYLQPVQPAEKKSITLAGATFTVIDVEPKQ